jgi:hypothetical protein
MNGWLLKTINSGSAFWLGVVKCFTSIMNHQMVDSINLLELGGLEVPREVECSGATIPPGRVCPGARGKDLVMISLDHLESWAGVIEILAVEEIETGINMHTVVRNGNGRRFKSMICTDGWRVKANLDVY